MRRAWPSIQPQQSPVSTASGYLIDAMPDAVLAKLYQRPGEVAGFAASQSAKARGVANGRVGRSGRVVFFVGMTVDECPPGGDRTRAGLDEAGSFTVARREGGAGIAGLPTTTQR